METTQLKTVEIIAFVKENKHLTRGFIDFGWGNGYVAVPYSHPCYGMSYDDIHDKYNIEVNGGLTFSAQADKDFWPEKPEGDWWIVGFDTAHYGDSLENWPDALSVLREAKRLKKQLTELQPA
jgi:hypothetical protein